MSIEGNQVAECSIRGSGSRDMQTSAKTERHMTKLELIDEMPPAFMDVKEIMKKIRSKRSAEEKSYQGLRRICKIFFRDAIRAGSLSRDTMDDICANMRMKVCEKIRSFLNKVIREMHFTLYWMELSMSWLILKEHLRNQRIKFMRKNA